MRRIWTGGVPIGLLVLLTSAAALAAKPKPGAWTGSTSQSLPISFHVSRGAGTVVNFEPEFKGSCTKRGSSPMSSLVITTDAGRNVSIKKGSFKASATGGKIHSRSVVLATTSDRLHGRFISKKKAKGTYSATFKFNRNAARYGLAGYTCTTGTVWWTATAG
jgi:hypothetical protein